MTRVEVRDLDEPGAVVSHPLGVVGEGKIRARHRVIADRVITYYQKHGQLGEALRGLVFAFATKVRSDTPWRAREKQLLIRLLNHELLLRLSKSVATVRGVYDEVESILNWDYQYWLQRGALEVETGDLSLAQNFLEQARSIAPRDPNVLAEWAYMVLKKATQEATAPDSHERAALAIDTLEESIEGRGARDPYPYHILGSQGLSWSRRAILTRDQRIELLSRLRRVVREGVRLHPRNVGLRGLLRDVEQEYLMMGVAKPAAGAAERSTGPPDPS
jgi:hypothetical protein